MDINELNNSFPKLVAMLCKNPEMARALEEDKAAVIPIVETEVVHTNPEVTIEMIRKTQSRFLTCRLDRR